MWRRLSSLADGGKIGALGSLPSDLRKRQPGPEMLSMTQWWIKQEFVWTILSPVAPTPRPLANTVADPISWSSGINGVQLHSTGSTSTERGRGKKGLFVGNQG